jgi:hypothetical protein
MRDGRWSIISSMLVSLIGCALLVGWWLHCGAREVWTNAISTGKSLSFVSQLHKSLFFLSQLQNCANNLLNFSNRAFYLPGAVSKTALIQ